MAGMTKERAMQILDPTHREHYDSIETVNEACEIGRQAISKRIPKRPEYWGDGYDDEGKLIYDNAKCPTCGNDEFEFEINNWGCKYCPDCGQALDWTQEAESDE